MNHGKDTSSHFNRKRGRPRIKRNLNWGGPWRCYAPRCETSGDDGIVSIHPEELELLRLIDLEGLEQEEAAGALGVSRRTVWKDIHDVRMKIADALVHGKGIEVMDCEIRKTGSCPRENEEFCPKTMKTCDAAKSGQDDVPPGGKENL